ncbi:MAG: hypothetical protein LWY06_02940 [Firmicutes bacterium]|nr:hypothetical protein [Bacillota bacterium]
MRGFAVKNVRLTVVMILLLALFMQYVEALEGTRPEYLCTHPHWSTRYNYMTAMIKKYRSE